MLYIIIKKHEIMSYPKKYPEKNGWFVYEMAAGKPTSLDVG